MDSIRALVELAPSADSMPTTNLLLAAIAAFPEDRALLARKFPPEGPFDCEGTLLGKAIVATLSAGVVSDQDQSASTATMQALSRGAGDLGDPLVIDTSKTDAAGPFISDTDAIQLQRLTEIVQAAAAIDGARNWMDIIIRQVADSILVTPISEEAATQLRKSLIAATRFSLSDGMLDEFLTAITTPRTSVAADYLLPSRIRFMMMLAAAKRGYSGLSPDMAALIDDGATQSLADRKGFDDHSIALWVSMKRPPVPTHTQEVLITASAVSRNPQLLAPYVQPYFEDLDRNDATALVISAFEAAEKPNPWLIETLRTRLDEAALSDRLARAMAEASRNDQRYLVVTYADALQLRSRRRDALIKAMLEAADQGKGAFKLVIDRLHSAFPEWRPSRAQVRQIRDLDSRFTHVAKSRATKRWLTRLIS